MLKGKICLVALGVLTVSVLAYGLAARYYAGYYFRGYEWNAPWGVSADIWTINPSVPSGDFLAEWDSVVQRYDPAYWVQLGYDKGTYANLRYYREKYDQNAWSIYFFQDGPSAGTWHDYTICHAQETDMRKWRFWIDNGDRGYYLVEPYEPKDHQAFVETTTTSIAIGDSHFEHISYYDGRTWSYWYIHVEREDYPYEVQEVSTMNSLPVKVLRDA